MRGSMRWFRWALLVPACIACGRSHGESAPDDGTAGRTDSSGGSLASSGGNAGTGGDTTNGGSSGASASGGAAGESEGGSAAGLSGAGATNAAGGSGLGGAAGGSGLGGAAGEFSSGGTVSAGTSSGGTEAEGGAPGDALEPVRIIRGAEEDYWDLTIRGEGLDEYDGLRVLVRIGHPERPPERLGSGEALIDGGAFELVFPAVWETDLYKTKLALIDVDGDRACDLSVDRLFQDSRASAAEVLYVSPGRRDARYDFTESAESVGEQHCNDWFNRDWPRE
jgi:hypothetical protein